jgi:PAS domain-containing protein
MLTVTGVPAGLYLMALVRRLPKTRSKRRASLAVDRHGRFTYVNRQAERMMGHGRQDLLAKNVWEAFPELLASRTYQEYQRVARERSTFVYPGRPAELGPAPLLHEVVSTDIDRVRLRVVAKCEWHDMWLPIRRRRDPRQALGLKVGNLLGSKHAHLDSPQLQ